MQNSTRVKLEELPYRSRNADPHNTPGEPRIQWSILPRKKMGIVVDWVDEQGIHQILIKNIDLKDVDRERKKAML